MISIVLIEPEHPGNIGAVARVIANFGFENLVIVNPKCAIDDEVLRLAKHAGNIVKKAKITTAKILAEFDYKIATTSQLGTDFNLTRTPIAPEQLAGILNTTAKNKSKIALIFGREGEGLHNDEINSCDFVVAIPTSKKYPTMNLSHSVAVVLYELSKKLLKENISSHITPISEAEKKQIMKMFNKVLAKLPFKTEQKKETQRKVWKRMISKSFLSKREAYALMGLLRKLIE
jgi:tRNA/rRNA methyltransferase